MKFKQISTIILLIGIWFLDCNKHHDESEYHYKIHRLKGAMTIDANWDKPQWQNKPSLSITNYMGEKPDFLPKTQAKVLYDDDNLYVIFRVEDQYVRAVATEFHGTVWKDACVEFFFAPHVAKPLKYFNVEMNCGGTALIYYNRVPEVDYIPLAIEDMQQIEIAHSLPETVNPEITEPVVWTLEYRLPLSILEKYAKITKPAKGVVWRANFQKCAETNSHPHWLTWAKIEFPEPRFHLPQFFGKIEFLE